jgi:hypothetical protein
MATPAVSTLSTPEPQYEFVNSKMLAERWCLPESWIRDQVCSRSSDPLPHIRFGKYVRFRWASPELNSWAQRRIIGASPKKGGRLSGRDIVQ